MPPVAARAQSPRTHELIASPTTVHRNFFDATLPPVLRIASGDIVRLETATGNPRYFTGGDCANGGKEVVNAVAEGKRAARGIERWLSGRRQ